MIADADPTPISVFSNDPTTLGSSDIIAALRENVPWWDEWMRQFLHSTAKYFSKPYTAGQLQTIMKHALHGTITDQCPATVQLTPTSVMISGGSFCVQWAYLLCPIMIELEAVSYTEPAATELQEFNTDDLPEISTEPLTMANPNMTYDRHRIKESRLKAKIALYRVQHQLAKFYERYGEEAMTSEDDSEESDEA